MALTVTAGNEGTEDFRKKVKGALGQICPAYTYEIESNGNVKAKPNPPFNGTW